MNDTQGLRSLEDVADVNAEALVAGTVRSKSFRYIDLSAVNRGRIDWAKVSQTSFAEAPSRARRVTRAGDVLFGTVRPALESHGAVPMTAEVGEFVASTGFAVLRARPGLSDPRFLAQYCFSQFVREDARRFEVGSNYPAVTEADVRKFRFPDFPVSDQLRIAEVLDSIDRQIVATNQVIHKLEAMNQGLSDDLIQQATARVDAGAADFQWVTLGSLVREHGGFIQTGPFGSQLHAYDYVSEGLPVVMPQDIGGGRVHLDQIARISGATAQRLSRHRMKFGDVIFARRGDLERCAAIGQREESWVCGTGCLLIRPPAKVLRPEWLALVYRHEIGQSHVRAHAVGSTMANLNTGILAAMRIPLPPPGEQDLALGAIASQEAMLDAERAHLSKLWSLKAALGSDLFTGDARVKPGAVS